MPSKESVMILGLSMETDSGFECHHHPCLWLEHLAHAAITLVALSHLEWRFDVRVRSMIV
jgi:hypothetical protein